jgi:hydrogenase maturation protease
MTQAPPPPKVLVACVGNPDRGDDGLGAAVARKLEAMLPANANLVERRGDLLALAGGLEGFDALICVDAAAPMGSPGKVHRIDLAGVELPRELLLTSTHGFGLADAIEFARALGQAPKHIIVYAVEGCRFDAGGAISPEIAAASQEAARLIAEEIDCLSAGSCAERETDTGAAP